MNNQVVWGIGGIAVLLMLVVGVRGCGHYGEVNSTTYEYGKALYSVCNRRDAERLEKVAAMIDSAMQKGEISKTEAGWLREIVDEARGTEWEKAMVMSRQLLSDQSDL
jgi:PBP1b-binding outer membrane lipoprotein LpoB